MREKKMIELYKIHSGVDPDVKDVASARERLDKWNKRKGARVGDYVIMADGSLERFAHDWGDSIQTCKSGSFYFGRGFASMSGALNPSIPKAKLRDTGTFKSGNFWFFHHDYWTASNAVGLSLSCRIFRYEE